MIKFNSVVALTAASMDDKGGSDLDAVWMVLAGDKIIDNVNDGVASGGSRSEYNLWTEDEISGDDSFDVVDYLPLSVDTRCSISSCDFDINDYISETNIGDTSEGSDFEAEEEFSEGALEKDKEPRTSTFAAPVLTNSISQTIETELFDSGRSEHMSPY